MEVCKGWGGIDEISEGVVSALGNEVAGHFEGAY